MAVHRDPQPYDARDVIPRIRAGDVAAFEALYLVLFPPLYEYAYRFVRSRDSAEDVVQEVFRRVWERRAECPPSDEVRAYLFAAVRNRIRKQWHHERVVEASAAQFSDDRMPGMGQQGEDPEQYIVSSELREVLDRALAELPESRREILLMRWQLGMSYPEIAHALGISVAAAQSQVSRFQRALRPLLRPLFRSD